ncbi:MAG TPA: ion channel [Candidatus Limnocylindria bacterium]
MVEVAEGIVGALVIVWIMNDVFQSVVVPRPTPGLRPSTILARLTWPAWRSLAERRRTAGRERLLAQYAPLLLVSLLGVWIVGLLFGYGLLFHALRGQLKPPPEDLLAAMYFAGTSLLTVGFGDVIALEPAARALSIAAAASGLGVVALSISFIFSLFANFQRREALVVTLDQRAGAPPSGVRLLETMATLRMRDALGPLFSDWERWAGEVLDTHVSYPILAYFRSTHDYESWIGALGAMLDAATLVSTAMNDGPSGEASMLCGAGAHLVEDVTSFFRLPHDHEVGVERREFEEAYATLASCGYAMKDLDEAWRDFATARSTYAGSLNALARNWSTPPALWINDRSYLPHAPG